MFILVLKYILVAVEIICSILLVGIILIQRSKSQGAGWLLEWVWGNLFSALKPEMFLPYYSYSGHHLSCQYHHSRNDAVGYQRKIGCR